MPLIHDVVHQVFCRDLLDVHIDTDLAAGVVQHFIEGRNPALGGFFGTLALVMVAMGLYGGVAYSTARRTGEIGLRIALGAPRAHVVWMILRGSLLLVALGLALGLPAAIAGARAVASVLFGIQPTDPFTFASTAALLAAIGAAAAFLPARGASRLDPSKVLRSE